MARKKQQRRRTNVERAPRAAESRRTGAAARAAVPGASVSAQSASVPTAVRALRARMDRLNARLAADVQARARLALEIAREKAKHGLPAADPVRERDMLRRVLDEAPPGLPRCDLARVFKTLFVASRELVLADRADDAPACPPRRRPTPGPRVGAGRSRGTRVRARPSGDTRVSARRSNQ